MLNCTDIDCILHHHHDDDDLMHHLQDDRAHHEHQIQIMSGDASDDVKETIQNILNGTTDSELSSLSHLDAPNDSLYMVCGVLIAMVLVAVIIILLAVTISKLRKREEHASVTTNHNNNVIRTPEAVVVPPPPPPPASAAESPLPPPFLWRYSNGTSNASSQYSLCNNDQTTLVHNLPCEEVSECNGFRKNLRGKWRRLVKKKPQQDVYTIPAELRDQLKQIYVY